MSQPPDLLSLLDDDDDDDVEVPNAGAPAAGLADFSALRNRILGSSAQQAAPSPVQPGIQMAPAQQILHQQQPRPPQQMQQSQQQWLPNGNAARLQVQQQPPQVAAQTQMHAAQAPSPQQSAARAAANVTVKELLDWLMPRLEPTARTEMQQAQAEYRRTAASDPAAKSLLIKRIHQIGGKDNILRFHSFKNQNAAAAAQQSAAARSTTPPARVSTPQAAASPPQHRMQPGPHGHSNLGPGLQAPTSMPAAPTLQPSPQQQRQNVDQVLRQVPIQMLTSAGMAANSAQVQAMVAAAAAARASQPPPQPTQPQQLQPGQQRQAIATPPPQQPAQQLQRQAALPQNIQIASPAQLQQQLLAQRAVQQQRLQAAGAAGTPPPVVHGVPTPSSAAMAPVSAGTPGAPSPSPYAGLQVSTPLPQPQVGMQQIRPQQPAAVQAPMPQPPAAAAAQVSAAGQAKGGRQREADPTDVLAGTGIDMEAEAAALTANVGAAGAVRTPAATGQPQPPTPLFTLPCLMARLSNIAPRHGVKSADIACHEFLATALRAHMQGLLERVAAAARHRGGASRRPAGLPLRRDLRREVLAIERRERLAAEDKARKEREALLQAAASRSKAADEETREKLQKVKQDEKERLDQAAANAAAQTAMGAAGKWASWGKKGGAADKKAAGADGAKKGGKAGKRGREDDGSGDPAKKAATGGAASTAAAPAPGSPAQPPARPAVNGTSANGTSSGTGTPGVTPVSGKPSGVEAAGNAVPRSLRFGGGADDGTVTIELKDLLAALERDPLYAKSPLMYQLLEADGLQ